MLEIKQVCEHSFFSPIDGVVLDIGCGNFDFAKKVLEHGATHVIAVDPNRLLLPPNEDRISFINSAVGENTRKDIYVENENHEENHLEKYSGDYITKQKSKYEIDVITIDKIMKDYKVEKFSLIKIDCEGAETEILRSITSCISEQITIEFHDHIDNSLYHIPYSFLNLYKIISNKKYERRGRLSHWDSLFVARKKC
jgi:FkbM family methyltransferase